MWYHGVPFFRALDDVEGRELMAISRPRRFAAGERIISEGDRGPGLFVIEIGEVVIQKKVLGSEPEVLARLQPGEFFGEMSLVTDLPTAAEAVAGEATTTIFLPRQDLTELLAEWPELELKVMREFVRALAHRLYEADELLITYRLFQ